MTYGNGVYITHLIHALCYDFTMPLISTFDGFNESCIKVGLVPFLTDQPQLVVPGMGNRAFAGITPDDIALGMLASKLIPVVENLFKTEDSLNIGMPFKRMIPTDLTENITPGFKYLREMADKSHDS